MNQQNTIRKEWEEQHDRLNDVDGLNMSSKQIADWFLERTIPLSSLTAWIEEREKHWQRENTYEGDEAGVYRTTVSEIFNDLSTFIEGKK